MLITSPIHVTGLSCGCVSRDLPQLFLAVLNKRYLSWLDCLDIHVSLFVYSKTSVLSLFKHNILVITCTQWRAEGGSDGATAPGIHPREPSKGPVFVNK